MYWDVWWVWMAAAIGLGVLEMLAPAFVLLGFALGAAFVGLGLLSGALIGMSFAALMAIFAIASLTAWLGLRMIFKKPGDTPKVFDHDIND